MLFVRNPEIPFEGQSLRGEFLLKRYMKHFSRFPETSLETGLVKPWNVRCRFR
jgi:hypothetical protein